MASLMFQNQKVDELKGHLWAVSWTARDHPAVTKFIKSGSSLLKFIHVLQNAAYEEEWQAIIKLTQNTEKIIWLWVLIGEG